MSIFITEEERKKTNSTCYFEFMKGEFKGKCWNVDSLNISEESWQEFKLTELFSRVKQSFDYYGITTIDADEWDKLVEIAENNCDWSMVIDEIYDWAINSLKENKFFSIMGM